MSTKIKNPLISIMVGTASIIITFVVLILNAIYNTDPVWKFITAILLVLFLIGNGKMLKVEIQKYNQMEGLK